VWARAVEYVISEAQACGCHAHRDAAGNIHVRPVGHDAGTPLWLCGSHLDSVPHGGDFDGVVGVVVPLELLRAAYDDGRKPLPLELIIFAEEEGTTFGLGMLGSRTWCGLLDAKRLAELRNAQGQNYLEAGSLLGVAAERFAADRLRADAYRGMVEVHIEQGPGMWNRDQPVAIVTRINGRRQYRAVISGIANHAGTTSMADRCDALAGAASMITAIEALPVALGQHAVATVGHIECRPNALNVIADSVQFTIDLRAPTDEALEQGNAALRCQLAEIAKRRQLKLTIDMTETAPATELASEVIVKLRTAAERVARSVVETVSGALHDAAIVGRFLPTAMLFIASRDGISHNPAEFSRMDDIALAARILYSMVGGDDEAA
jgi:allantoate deiminase